MLSPDFKEFIELLNHHEVKYMIVGGYAMAIYGRPRYTKDIDIFILADDDNAEKMVNVFEKFGFGSIQLKKDDFKTPGTFIQIGYPPERIDILNQADGIVFEDCYSRREQKNINGVVVPFISVKDLIINKKASGRTQDKADAEALEE